MHDYNGVSTRFLRHDERLVSSQELEMPLVIEAKDRADVPFLQQFLAENSVQIIADLAKYGAILLRGFDIASDEDFEKTVLSIKGFYGISEAFMSEQGRIPVDHLKYVLHTNAVYKTGGTLYLGGFHSENYYSPDVPSYISFCCHVPSEKGGETGLVNMEKVFASLSDDLKEKLEKKNYFVAKWLVTEVSERYQVSIDVIEKICKRFSLPIVGKGNKQFILMYKPNIFVHPLTQKKALQINLFELPTLNTELRKCFVSDYQGKTWIWHRLVWKLPLSILKILELCYVMVASLIFSPKESFNILKTKFKVFYASMTKDHLLNYPKDRVGSCFNDEDIKKLARLIRCYYVSCLWRKGDIVLVDNKKVAHAGMPGAGKRKIRALICNPLEMSYSFNQSGSCYCQPRNSAAIGEELSNTNQLTEFGNEYE